MASINTRLNKDGSTTFRVMFRIDGRQAQESFVDAAAAGRFKTLVERVGGGPARDILLAEDGADEPPLPTLADWVETYLDPESGLLTGVTPGTRDGYRQAAGLSFLERLGDLPLDHLTPESVRAWLNWQVEQMSQRFPDRNVSGKTVKNYHAILSGALSSAVSQKLIPTNTARGIRLPKPSRTPPVFLTEGEFAHIYRHTPAHYQPLMLTLAGSGMRFGEATALTWGDLVQIGGEWALSVNKAWKRAPQGGSVLGSPKSEAGVRLVSIGDDLVRALGPRQDAHALIFRNRAGNRMLVSAFSRFAMGRALKDSGFDRTPRVHDLRHSHASWLIAKGVPLPYIQRRLGHEKIETTVDVYGHLLPEALSATRDAAVAAIAGALAA